MRAQLGSLPSAPKEYVLDFPRLDGGLNLRELDYRMDSNQSPQMQNLCWRDGVLSCRDGQVWLTEEAALGEGFACFREPFWGHAFFHIGSGIYHLDLTAVPEGVEQMILTELITGIPENAGTFFRFGDALYYKNRGGYVKIGYDSEEGFTGENVEAYTPIVLINGAPATGSGDLYQPENRLSARKTVWYSSVSGVKVYHLPVKEIDSVDKVVVDEVELAEGTGYTVDLAAGTVTFTTAPAYHNPVAANTVRITFAKADAKTERSVMDCVYAETYGGDQNVCVVLAGCGEQPNAYFWSGNHAAMDPGYFPVSQYNLAGDTEEAITGFGKQQDLLVVFKEHSVGKVSFATEEMDTGRVLLAMPYTRINDRIGCDLPGTIQLISNNLVFCNRAQGVYMLRDSSAAYENNIVCISQNVNGTDTRPGLLSQVRKTKRACSFDDDGRYWLVSGGAAYVWDYSLSTCSDPSWFYHTGIHAVGFLSDGEAKYHLNGQGRVTALRLVYSDYGEPIEKVYQFATQYMGGYDRVKNITGVLFAVRSDTDSVIHITYTTDHEIREDLTPIRSFSWRVSPRNLAYRCLSVRRFATVARRRPGCRHVRHFTMTLRNAESGSDMSVVSAQIFFKYQGRER